MLQRLKTTFCNLAWMTYSWWSGPSITNWHSDLRNRQWTTLKHILKRNENSEIGDFYQFSDINSIREYQRSVPLFTYDDYRPAIGRIARGEQQVLTNDCVRKLEPTGGSTGASKLIPYTDELLERFQRGIKPWIVNLFRAYPRLLTGKAYWSISPNQEQQPETPGDVSVGFDRDSEYVGSNAEGFVSEIMAVPDEVKCLEDMETFRYVTLLFLLSCRELTLISVWHPTFLTLLMDPLSAWKNRLMTDLSDGTIRHAPTSISEPLRSQLEPRLQPDPTRSREIRFVFREQNRNVRSSDGTDRHTLFERLWPELTVISCWTDGPAERFVQDVQNRFPSVDIQPKGLVATEGILTIPTGNGKRILPALDSHFLEFRSRSDNTDDRTVRTVDELEEGRSYSVILTNGGGLYRYQLFDQVTVTDYYGACPVLRFEGKQDHISDLFGEKIHASHLDECVQTLLSNVNEASSDFWFLAPVNQNGQFAYTLFIHLQNSVTNNRLRRLGTLLEEELRSNYHYDYCRELSQLSHVRIFRIDSSFEKSLQTFVSVNRDRGQNYGDIKPSPLHTYEHWHEEFRGEFI